MSNNNTAQDLNDLLVTRNFEVSPIDSKTGRPPVNDKGQPDTNKADSFSFDYIAPTGQNYGTVEILLGPDNTMLVGSGDNTARGMEEYDKDDWFKFLSQLSNFAKQHLLDFSISNFNKLKLARQQMALVTESFIGNKHYSFTGAPTEARLMIKHNKVMGENDQRFRYIESLFIETTDGERFKLKTRSLVEGRAQLQHVREGGRPWDDRGRHISDLVEQAKVLSQFRRAHQGKVFEGEAGSLIAESNQYYETLRHDIKSLSTASGYKKYFESWDPSSALTEQDALVEDIKDLFVETRIDPRIEQALPLLMQIKEGTMKEADIFEAWADQLIKSEMTPQDENTLETLMSQPLPVGPDALNAIEQLPDEFTGDEQLIHVLKELAEADPDANIWENPQVVHRFAELGFEIPEPTAQPEPPVEEPPVEEPPVEEPAVAEGTAGALVGAAGGALLTKTPTGASIGAEIGSAIQDKLTGNETNEDNTPGAIGFMKESGTMLKRLQELANIK